MEYLTWSRKKIISEIKSASHIMSMKIFSGEIKAEKFIIYTDKHDDELNKKTNQQLQNIYFDIKKHDAEFKKQVHEDIEKKLFYHQESANADYQHWGKYAYWSIEEGIALLLGKDPRIVKWEEVALHAHHSPFAKKFEEINSLAIRYIACKQLECSSMPGVFLAWAKRMGYEADPALVRVVESLGHQIADWPTLHKQAMELVNQQDQKISELEKKIQEKEKQLEEQADELKETERQSLYKLVSIMAYDGFKFKLADKKSPIPNDLANAAPEIIGETIDADTVRKWLRKAIEKYPLIIKS